jgi:hypothetical protein
MSEFLFFVPLYLTTDLSPLDYFSIFTQPLLTPFRDLLQETHFPE